MAEKKTNRLKLERNVERMPSGAYEVRRADFEALTSVVNAIDNGRIERAVVSMVDTFAEKLHTMKKSLPGDLRQTATKTIEVPDEVMGAILSTIKNPPDRVQFIGNEFRKLFVKLYAFDDAKGE